MKAELRITVCAFTDGQKNSVVYRNFSKIEKAVEFYRKQLEKDCVNVVSTRKIGVKNE